MLTLNQQTIHRLYLGSDIDLDPGFFLKRGEKRDTMTKEETQEQSNNQEQEESAQESSTPEAVEPKKPIDMSKEELLELVQRTQANFANYKKTSEEHNKEMVKYANRKLLTELLPTLDSFEMALKGSENAQGDVKNFLIGMKMVLDGFLKVLEQNKIRKIAQIKTFDPKLHEPIEKVASDKPEGTILEVISSGYMLQDRVIRAARVKVSAGK